MYLAISYVKGDMDRSEGWIIQQEDIMQESESSYKQVEKSQFSVDLGSASTWATAI
jgi:hypothetical protein